jgi:hypothetical protein
MTVMYPKCASPLCDSFIGGVVAFSLVIVTLPFLLLHNTTSSLNMEEEEREAPRKRPVTMTMPDPQLSISSLHTDIAALASGLAHTTDNTYGRSFIRD